MALSEMESGNAILKPVKTFYSHSYYFLSSGSLHFLQTVLVEGFTVPQDGHGIGLTADGGRKHIVYSPFILDN